MPTPTVETSPRAREILKAADELLAERGHDAVSMRDIAHRAGVNKALIFYYYGSRAQLFERVLADYLYNHEQALSRAMDDQGSAAAQLHHTVDVYLDFIEHNELFARMVQQELSRQEPQLVVLREHVARLHAVMQAALGDVLPSDGTTSLQLLFRTLVSLLIAHGVNDDEGVEAAEVFAAPDRRRHIHWLADAALAALTA